MTDEQVAVIRRLRAQGLSYRRIAGEIGINYKAIWRSVHSLQTSTPRRNGRPRIQLPVDEITARFLAGEPGRALAQDYCVNEKTIRARLGEAGVSRPPRSKARQLSAAERFTALWVSAREARTLIGCDRSDLNRWLKAGRFRHAFQLDGHFWIIPRRSVAEFIAARQKAPND